MNLQKFSLKSQDEHSYTIAHPNGKTLHVKKADLSKKSHEVIQKMAVGGGVKGVTEGSPLAVLSEPPAATIPSPDPSGATGFPPDTSKGVPAGPMTSDQPPLPSAPISIAPAVKPSGATAANPIGPSNLEDLVAKGLLTPLQASNYQILQAQEAAKNANTAEAQALGGAGIAEAGAIQQGLSDIKNKTLTAAQIDEKYRNNDDALAKLYNSKTVDPDRFLKNQRLPSKLLSGISMILGGIGGGLTHTPNAALSVMEKQIDNDIDAQKNDQSKVMNLWKMNRAALGTDLEANSATQNQIYTGIKYKIQQAAASSQNPLAIARAQAANSLIDQSIAVNRQKLAILGGDDVPPEKKIPFLVPAALQKEAFTEAGQARNAMDSEDEIKILFDKAAHETRPLSGGSLAYANPWVESPSSKNLQILGDPLIKDVDGRVNQFEKDDWNKNLPQFGDSNETVDAKKKAIIDFIQHKKSTPILTGHGIKLPPSAAVRRVSINGQETLVK